MLRKLQEVIRVTVSVACLLTALAVMFSDIFNIDLNKLIIAALMLSVILGSIPFFLISQTGKK